ncbi:peroxisomal biogenesis factor 19 isoform X2 [Diaphorina citri]|uniref:Peroxin-19 n=1 Tax=Diaphorina citri TaxID=121845 RepID=A0A3Q0IN00_DIACI|nr:peroxisomal biogenesis factor 19 isoform X2 [Diaphorina citri]
MENLLETVKKSSSIKPSPSTKATTSNVLPPDENLWSDEYFQQMTQDLQKNMESLVNGDPSQLDSLLEHLMNDVAKVSTDGQTSSSIPNTCSSSEDAQSIEDKLKATMDEITQGLSNLPVNNLGNIMRGEGDESTGDGASPNMMPFLEDIMQQFLSKDVLYPVFSETCAKYPEWLEKNKKRRLHAKNHYCFYHKPILCYHSVRELSSISPLFLFRSNETTATLDSCGLRRSMPIP